MRDDVDAREIGRAERRRLRAAGEHAGEHVGFVDREAVLLHQPNREHHAEHAESVGDEAGNVLRDDDALAENAIAERARGVDRFLRRVRRRNDLEQVQVARRIEEVHAEKARRGTTPSVPRASIVIGMPDVFDATIVCSGSSARAARTARASARAAR